MSRLIRFLLFCVLYVALANGQQQDIKKPSDTGRGLASSYDPEEKQTDGLKKNAHIFLGIYKNYKSTYLGNKTTNEYKKRLRDRVTGQLLPTTNEEAPEDEQNIEETTEQPVTESDVMETQTESPMDGDNSDTVLGKKRRKRKRKYRNNNKEHGEQKPQGEEIVEELLQTYHVGPSLNVSLDMTNDIVRVKLDGENLKEIVAARWLSSDNSEEGRGKKYDMITKVLPLFILPFLIQSAIVPFLVTKLKLLLVKSILVGKLAIFLLIISAIKNSNKQMQAYEVAPSYWASEPSRRSELAAAASSAAYNGYRVEGKPTTWIN